MGPKLLFKNQPAFVKSGRGLVDWRGSINFSCLGKLIVDKHYGIDYLAIGSYRDRENLFEVHETLLGAGIWIIEAIDLSGVKAGQYELICLPLRLAQGDAAPARAILRPI